MLESHKEESMYVPQMNALLNRWFTSYEEARTSLEAQGGYLFPYGKQYFVTEEEGVRALGLSPEDPNWEKIGRDWVQPQDEEAWQTLKEQREHVTLSRGG